MATRLDVAPAALAALSSRLDATERARAARFRFERHRRRYSVARARLRELLAERLGAAPESIAFARGEHGKPSLAEPFARSGWRFNLSHCGELALYAFSRRGELGVDVEAVRELAEADAIAAQLFTRSELEGYRALRPHERPLGFFTRWTRKEAFAKALGRGLSLPLGSIDVSAAPRGWRLESFAPAPGFVAALAHR